MKCRYCGQDLYCVNDTLASVNGFRCAGNGNGFHVGITDGTNCIYCGRPVRIVSYRLSTTFGFKCSHSPTGGHSLQ